MKKAFAIFIIIVVILGLTLSGVFAPRAPQSPAFIGPSEQPPTSMKGPSGPPPSATPGSSPIEIY
jgi:hypothetical protein